AYRVNTRSKCRDAGEPRGTAGRPLLELLHKRNMENVALCVVRYFGGTQLGAGRLLRTYLRSGITVIDSATLERLER
ncbi:MAG: YigZ family protein, partial [Erysipelotrichia bacterium]|nr:YigZ family protein [Erysipelotrichia bacterium]